MVLTSLSFVFLYLFLISVLGYSTSRCKHHSILLLSWFWVEIPLNVFSTYVVLIKSQSPWRMSIRKVQHTQIRCTFSLVRNICDVSQPFLIRIKSWYEWAWGDSVATKVFAEQLESTPVPGWILVNLTIRLSIYKNHAPRQAKSNALRGILAQWKQPAWYPLPFFVISHFLILLAVLSVYKCWQFCVRVYEYFWMFHPAGISLDVWVWAWFPFPWSEVSVSHIVALVMMKSSREGILRFYQTSQVEVLRRYVHWWGVFRGKETVQVWPTTEMNSRFGRDWWGAGGWRSKVSESGLWRLHNSHLGLAIWI